MTKIYQRLQRISPYLWPRYSFTVENLNSNPLLKRLFDQNKDCPSFCDRHVYFQYIMEATIKGRPIDYLEFGVYKGDSIKEWIDLNRHLDSRFYGFDTFTGLPENWTYAVKKGAFNLDGNIPELKDSRVKMIRGLFQDTLIPFLNTFKRRNMMIIHLDADLFSSTLYVLTQLDSVLNKGDVLMFDEFSSIAGEFKAFDLYKQAYRRAFRMISKVRFYGWLCDQVAFIVD